MAKWLFLVLGLFFGTPIDASLPTFPPDNRQICSEHGYNWAAEIRCLRDVIDTLLSGNQSERSRGSRSLTQPQPNASEIPMYGAAAHPFLRTYVRPNYHLPPVPIVKPYVSGPSSSNCKCEGLEKLSANVEKRLYDVKMRTQHDAEEKIRELERKFDNEMNEMRRTTTKDVSDINRKLTYIQAPRTQNNEHEYFFIDKEESWYGASEHCIGYGAKLASIGGYVENGLVSRLVPTNQTAWIGVNDVQKENQFKNADGTPLLFFRWAPKQPNNEEHNENCVEIDQNGRWNDKLCLILRPFVCKKKRNN